jgi:hypothetical protein
LSRLPALALALASALAGCSGQGPMSPYFLAPGTVARGPGPYVVSVCYNSAAHSADELTRGVEPDCHGAVFLRREGDLTSCSLLFPMRADFRCEKLSNSLATERPPMPLVPIAK